MTSDLHARLRDSLDQHTSTVRVPPVDVGELVRRGKRRRAGASGVALAATAAMVAATVAVPLALLDGDSSGTQLPVATGGATGPEPVDGPTGLFVTQDRVYLDGKSYPVQGAFESSAHVGQRGVAFPNPDPKSNRPMLLKRDGEVTPLGAAKPARDNAQYDPWVAADSNGPLVAWAEISKEGVDVVAFDTSTMREVGRKTVHPCSSIVNSDVTVVAPATGGPIPTGDPAPDIPLPSVKPESVKTVTKVCPRPYVVSDGIVFITFSDGTQAWDPVADSAATVSDGHIQQAHNKVLTTFSGRVGVDQLGADWQQAPTKDDGDSLLSYDGGWLLNSNGNPKVVNWRDPSQSITYDPPGQVIAATFDTDGSVLVVTNDAAPPTAEPDAAGVRAVPELVDGALGQPSGTYTGWDCTLGGGCEQVVAPTKDEIRLVGWDT